MARNNAGLLLVTSGVTGQLQNFSSQILQHGGHIDSSTDTNAVGILSFLQVASSSRNRELQTSTEALGDLLRVLTTTALSAACKNLTCFSSISILHASKCTLLYRGKYEEQVSTFPPNHANCSSELLRGQRRYWQLWQAFYFNIYNGNT